MGIGISPNASGGNLGSTTAVWDKLFVKEVNSDARLSNNASLSYRQNLTEYNAGDFAYIEELAKQGLYIVCTEGGTSSDHQPDAYAEGAENDIITDGTAKFAIKKVVDKDHVSKEIRTATMPIDSLQRETTYEKGALATSALLDVGLFLECSTAGETAQTFDGSLLVKLKEGNYYSDGGSIFICRKVASKEDVKNATREKPMLQLSTNGVTIAGVGATSTVTATWRGGGTLKAVSSDTEIATVKVSGYNITITNVAEGSASVTVTLSATDAYFGDEATLTVNTLDMLEPNLTLSEQNINVVEADTATVTATFDGDGTLSAQSNDSTIATVAVEGNTITVTGVNEGQAFITVQTSATSTYLAGTKTFGVFVSAHARTLPTLTLSASTSKVGVGKNITVLVNYDGDGALTASTSDPNVATASISGTNVTVTGQGNGTVTITVNSARTLNYYSNSASITLTGVSYRVMTVYIDETNSNPATCCSYGDDAVGMERGSDEWDEFFGEYPCLLKNGVENGKLDPNNYNLFLDGSTADITTGAAGDVMVCFPRRGYKISKSGSKVTVSMTDDPNASGYVYYPFNYSGVKNSLYITAYNASSATDGKYYSISTGVTAAWGTTSISALRGYVNSKGSRWKMWGFYQVLLLQIMYVLKFANFTLTSTCVQSYGGCGSANTAGLTNKVGDNVSQTSKMFGLEGIFGTTNCHADGILSSYSTDYSSVAKIATDAAFFGQTNQYTTISFSTPNLYSNRYLRSVKGDNITPFFSGGTQSGASQTTYYCSMINVQRNSSWRETISAFSVNTGIFGLDNYLGFVGTSSDSTLWKQGWTLRLMTFSND